MLKIGATLAVLVLGSTPIALADDLIGQASVIDGDTLGIHGTRIRLWGAYHPVGVTHTFCKAILPNLDSLSKERTTAFVF